MNDKKLLYIETFGCQMNDRDSEIMRQLLAATHDVTDAMHAADAIIVNTCAVTAEAERQARQAIRRLRRDNPGARIIVTLLHEMKRRNVALGLATACVGGGQGVAMVFERV